MDVYIVIGITVFLLLIAATWVIARKYPDSSFTHENPPPETLPPVIPQVTIDLDSVHRAIEKLPGKLLSSIQGSINPKKGALGELIGYIQLKAEYDRIYPLGIIADFMCIKLPTKEEAGRVDFIDVKTGSRARLSKEQQALKKLLAAGRVQLIQLTLDTDEIKSL